MNKLIYITKQINPLIRNQLKTQNRCFSSVKNRSHNSGIRNIERNLPKSSVQPFTTSSVNGYRDDRRSDLNGYRDDRRSDLNGYRDDRRSDWGYNEDRNTPDDNESNSFDSVAIKKNLLSESHVERNAEENASFLRQNNITVNSSNIPSPILEFSDYAFNGGFAKKLEQQFDRPTPIQSVGWSVALSGHDLIGVGQTGSGKTLGFVLPMLEHILIQMQEYKSSGFKRQCHTPLGLILAPTRELAQQIQNVVREYGGSVGIRSTCVFGGASKYNQIDSIIRDAPPIIIGTPGRILDLMAGDRLLSFDHTSYVVLDEADRMLDMGFEPQISKIIQKTRADRQTLMWSATWPSEVRDLANRFIKNPIRFTVGSEDLRANPNITQETIVLEHFTEKMDHLFDIVQNISDKNEQIMVFCNTKRAVDSVSSVLSRRGVRCQEIHGDKSQAQRDTVIRNFRQGRTKVLVSTEVAARGLDVPSVCCVVNYDLPNNIEDYVHRIGRTGRQNRRGKSVSFVTPEDSHVAHKLIKVIKDAGQQPDEELLNYIASYAPVKKSFPSKRRQDFGSGYGNDFRRNDNRNYGGFNNRRNNNNYRIKNFGGSRNFDRDFE